MTPRRTALVATLTVLALGGGTAAALTTNGSEGPATSGVSTAAVDVPAGSGTWDSSVVHDIAVEVDDAAVAAMIDSYQETGDDDLTPLIDLLDFLNNSTDAEFEDGLAERLDVKAFARYLAFEDLVGNTDDIDGPGNNSYLRYDAESGGFTVVAWDHNLAFGGVGGPGGFGGPRGEMGERPEGMPEGMEPPEGMRGGSNVLVERFTAVEAWAELVEQARADLVESLYASGRADEVIDQWADLLTSQSGDLVDAETVTEEADAVRDADAEQS